MRARVAILVVAALLALPSAALAVTQVTRSGNLAVTFTFKGTFPEFSGLHLQIVRAGQVLYDAPVTSRLCPNPCTPGDPSAHGRSARILDLESNNEPDVLLGLYTGGAHCCFVDQVYRFDPGTLTYVKTEHYFGNAGAAIRDLHHDGHLEFVSTNDAFYYRFGSFADSGAPVQIWSFRAGRFADITRRFPRVIRRDAALWWKLFTHHYDAGQSLIAPWAADEDLLGHSALVKKTLTKQLALGHLSGGLISSGRRYVAALQKFLHRQGYV
ncbi:MAG: hypothetical protein ACXVEW_05440 [Solirubrobacteraceae bacterium]